MTWDTDNRQSLDVKRFLDAIVEVCKDHDFSIAHEDPHGAFIIDPYLDSNIAWLRDAGYRTSRKRGRS